MTSFMIWLRLAVISSTRAVEGEPYHRFCFKMLYNSIESDTSIPEWMQVLLSAADLVPSHITKEDIFSFYPNYNMIWNMVWAISAIWAANRIRAVDVTLQTSINRLSEWNVWYVNV